MIKRSDLGVNLYNNIFHTRSDQRISNLRYKVVKGFALRLESKENVSSNHANGTFTWSIKVVMGSHN